MRHIEDLQRACVELGEEPQFLACDGGGRTIHYVRIGRRTDLPLVVWLHGSPGTFLHFADFLVDPALQQQANLLAIDRPGFGGSEYGRIIPDLHEQAEVLSRVFQENRSVRTIVVGHSFGGPVAARLAMDHPQLVDQLLLISPALDPQARAWWYPWFPVLHSRPLRWLFSRELQLYAQEAMAHRQELRAMDPLWADVRIPITVLHGDKDVNVPVQNAQYVRDKLKHSTRVDVRILPGAAHDLLWDRKDMVRDILLEMLQAA